MRFENFITGVDSHTAGEPTRIVTSGLPPLLGATMQEKLDYARNKMDHLRTALVCEPRGHEAIVIAYVLPPISPEAQFGIIFANNVGYLGMCGHGLIGVATVLTEMGMIQRVEGISKTVFETVAGLVEAQVLVQRGQVKHVTIQNVPSYVVADQVELDVDGIGKVVGDIVYGGNWFYLVRAEQLALSLESGKIDELLCASLRIRRALDENRLSEVSTSHALLGKVDHIKIYEPVQSHQHGSRSFVLCPGGVYDRSPCGTGMSAEMALMYKRKAIALGQEYACVSSIGTEFRGSVISETNVGKYLAVIPEITGSAYITGINQFVVDTNDPFKFGIQNR